MAETRLGAALTDAHRIAQVQLSGEAVAASRLLFSTLDPSDVPGTKAEWMALQMTLMKHYDEKSAGLAASYLSEYRSAELGDSQGPIAGVADFDAERVARSMDAMGPGKLVQYSGPDVDRLGARSAALVSDKAFPRLAGAVRRHVLGGGRRTLADSARRDKRAGGWRRVSDGKPCAFCAMLVTRGPVYFSEETALGMRKYHDDCGCGAEIVYGTWTPTKLEQQFIDAYDDAADAASAGEGIRVAPTASDPRDTVLHRMRRNDAELFSDSVIPKTEPSIVAARTLTEDEGRALGKRVWFDFADNVEPTDAQMVRIYTGNSYGAINGALREGDFAYLSPNQRDSIDALDRVIDAAPRVPEKITVSRAVGADVFGLNKDSDLSTVLGVPFRDDAFVSTALQSKLTYLERNEVELRLDVPAGTQGLYVSAHERGDKSLAVFGPEENELILGRGIEYEFDDAFVEDGKRVLVGRILRQNGVARG